jgi:ankyrin repeat protein
MRYQYFTLSLFFLLFVPLLESCKQTAAVQEQKKEEWHMLDEQAPQPQVQAGAAEEELLRQLALEGELEEVKKLMNSGVDFMAVDQEGHTALMYAAFNGHSKIVLALLEEGAELDQRDVMARTALLYAATGPFPETVSILLDRGADPNAIDNDEHFSPLMHAAAEGHLEVVKKLMERGADPSLKDIDGDDALSFAYQAGHAGVVEYLQTINKK